MFDDWKAMERFIQTFIGGLLLALVSYGVNKLSTLDDRLIQLNTTVAVLTERGSLVQKNEINIKEMQEDIDKILERLIIIERNRQGL